jgi:RNA methyltransferase, TrmH family
VSYTLTKAQITHIKQLQDNKYRKEFGVYIAEGEKILQEFLKNPTLIDQIFSSKPLPIPHLLITEVQMAKISALQTPTSVLAIIQMEAEKLVIDSSTFYLLLDGIQDPGNMGTIVRIADWYGIQNIVCSPESADAYSPKAVQASMGSISRVAVHRLSLVDLLSNESNMPTYVAVLDGVAINTVAKGVAGFIIIGSEGRGVSSEVMQLCKTKITIPGAGQCESLNASVACGIICSHLINL